MNKEEKIDRIKDFMKGKEFNTQQALTKAINSELNFKVTQSYISRNLEKLKIEKGKDNKYRLIKQHEIAHNREKLKKMMQKNVKNDFHDPAFLFLKVKDRYSEIIGKQIESSFPNIVLGTISKRKNLLVIYKNEKPKCEKFEKFMTQVLN